MLIKYTIQITWFVNDSHTKVTSPRTGRKKAAQKLKLHFIRIRHCGECICRWVWVFAQLECFDVTWNKFWNVAHTKNFENRQPPLFRFAMAERRRQRGQPNLGGRPKGHRDTCLNLDLRDNERRWKWKRSKLLVSFNTVVWATWQNMFLDLLEQPSCAKLQTQRQTQTQRQMHSPQWRIRMKWSLSFCAAFFLPVRGDVTFVWESVRNHVIVIV